MHLKLPRWLKSKNVDVVFKTIFYSALGVSVLVIFFTFHKSKINDWEQLTSKRDNFQEANEIISEDIAEHKQQQIMFNTDLEYVIMVAHDENKVLLDELVFIFPRPRK